MKNFGLKKKKKKKKKNPNEHLREEKYIFPLLEKVPQDLFHSVYFEYEENCTHDRLLSLNYTFCHIKR